MDDNTLLNLTIGDLVTSGTLLWEDDADKTVWLIRQGDEIHVRTEWKNLQALVDANAREAAEFSRSGRLGEMVKVASIPNAIYYDWKEKGYTEDPTKMARLLNDGDYGKFRTNNLRV